MSKRESVAARPERPLPGAEASIVTRLLSAPLGVSLFGIALPADIYVRNALRVLGLNSSIDDAALERAAQRFRNLQRLGRGERSADGAQMGIRPRDALESVALLEDPRHRLSTELFCPYLSDQELRAPPAEGSARGGDPPATRALVTHALAIVHHSRVIQKESAGAGADELMPAWRRALDLWSQVAASEPFWAHFLQRAEALDDPRLRSEDVVDARRRLPQVILAWNQLFLSACAKAADQVGVDRHLELMHGCSFPRDDRAAALRRATGDLAKIRLGPLVDQLRQATSGTVKLKRRQAGEALQPALLEAQALRDHLVERVPSSPGEGLELPEYDALAEAALEVVSGEKLDYSDEQQRVLVFSATATRKLLELPISGAMRRRVDAALQSDLKILYRGFVPAWNGTDACRCWFLPAEEADADASILLPVYKIGSVRGASVRWEARQVVVPRSRRAKQVHEGKAAVPDLVELAGSTRDAKTLDLIARIRRIDEEAGAQASREREFMEAEKRAAEAAQAAALWQHEQVAAAQAARDREHLDAVQRAHQGRVQAEQRRHGKALETARATARPRIAEAEQVYRSVADLNRGVLGLLKAPPAVLGLVSLAIGAVIFTAAKTLPGAAVGAAALSAVLIALGGLVEARNRRVAAARRPLEAAKATLVAEEEGVAREHKEALGRLEWQARDEGAEAKAREAARSAEAERIRSQGVARVADIQRAGRTALEAIESKTVAATKGLRAELDVRFKPKPQSESKAFPAYRKALAEGYKEGARPSEQEVNSMVQREVSKLFDSLSSGEAEVLKLMLAKLDNDACQQLIEALIDLPAAERGRRLFEMLTRIARG